MQRRIFLDEERDRAFKREGYVVVDMLSKDEALALREKAAALRSGVRAPFYASLWSKDRNYRASVDELVKGALETKALSYLDHHKSLFADLLVKRPSLRHHFPAHQDWTFVDEEHFASVYLWCPLQDVNRRNGTLQVFPRTHRMMEKIRGANMLPEYARFAGHLSKTFGEHLNLRAGQAVFFNQALLHASRPNHSLRTRIAAGLLFLPLEAQVWHYYRDPQTDQCYKVPADYEFFMRYSEAIDFRQGLAAQTIPVPGQASSIPFTHKPLPFDFAEFAARYRAELASSA
jgi:hypothetical protein